MPSVQYITRFTNRKGTQAQFNALYPLRYDGVGGVDLEKFPNVLAQGEIGLCTDTNRAFMGNINGEYIELATDSAITDRVLLLPFVKYLLPTSTFKPIPGLTFKAAPLINLEYSVFDSAGYDWTRPGLEYTKNGKITITCIDGVVTLMDTAVEESPDYNYDIYFNTVYDNSGSICSVLYRHNYNTTLLFSTHSTQWAPFI